MRTLTDRPNRGLRIYPEPESFLQVSVFETALGWMGLVESAEGVVTVRAGHSSEVETLQSVSEWGDAVLGAKTPVARRLVAYCQGSGDDFRDVALDTARASGGAWTAFRSAVTRACRAIPPGQTKSYADVAVRAGKAGASRAVGSVMARNPWPIIVPCHRVVRSDGSLGGFSAPTGLRFKEALLGVERTS